MGSKYHARRGRRRMDAARREGRTPADSHVSIHWDGRTRRLSGRFRRAFAAELERALLEAAKQGNLEGGRIIDGPFSYELRGSFPAKAWPAWKIALPRLTWQDGSILTMGRIRPWMLQTIEAIAMKFGGMLKMGSHNRMGSRDGVNPIAF